MNLGSSIAQRLAGCSFSQEDSGSGQQQGNIFIDSFLRRSSGVLRINVPHLSIAQMRNYYAQWFNTDNWERYCLGQNFAEDMGEAAKWSILLDPIDNLRALKGKMKVLSSRELIFAYLSYVQATRDFTILQDVILETTDSVGEKRTPVYVSFRDVIYIDTWAGDRHLPVKYAVGCQMKSAK